MIRLAQTRKIGEVAGISAMLLSVGCNFLAPPKIDPYYAKQKETVSVYTGPSSETDDRFDSRFVSAETRPDLVRVPTPPPEWIPPVLAVLDLAIIHGLPANTGLSQAISEALRAELHMSGWYRLLAYTDMNALLDAQKFNAQCSTVDCAIEAGSILSARHIVVGTLSKVGKTHQAIIRIIDVESGEITSSARALLDDEADERLLHLVRGLVRDLLHDRTQGEKPRLPATR